MTAYYFYAMQDTFDKTLELVTIIEAEIGKE